MRRGVLVFLAGGAIALLASFAPRARTATANEVKPKALFVLALGVNRSVDADQERLRYADDDAVRFQDLFRALGARVYLLARLDENTRRLHPGAASAARPPTSESFAQVAGALVRDVREAARRGAETAFYFVYAGHGRLREDAGYLSLEDRRISGEDLGALIDRVAASEAHVLVDACHAEFLAHGRGAGGERRPVRGYAGLAGLARNPRVGLFLSSSSTGESHEWEGFQAGVFSHEVRSGLYGAADADTDGRVSYRELTAFVMRANAAIVNERYRPRVVVRAPQVTGSVLDLRPGLHQRLEFDGTEPSARHFLEDELGVRLLDLNNAPGQKVSLVRPSAQGRLFLHRASDGSEFVVPPAEEVTVMSRLAPQSSTSARRGGAHQAFSSVFALPFGRAVVDATEVGSDAEVVARAVDAEAGRPRAPLVTGRRLAWLSGGVALGGAVAATALYWSAVDVRGEITPRSSHADVVSANRSATRRQRWAGLAAAAGVAAGLTSLWLLLDDAAPEGPSLSVAPEGLGATWSGRY